MLKIEHHVFSLLFLFCYCSLFKNNLPIMVATIAFRLLNYDNHPVIFMKIGEFQPVSTSLHLCISLFMGLPAFLLHFRCNFFNNCRIILEFCSHGLCSVVYFMIIALILHSSTFVPQMISALCFWKINTEDIYAHSRICTF